MAYSSPRSFLLSLRPPLSAVEQLFTAGLIWPVVMQERRCYLIPPEILAALPPVPLHDTQLRVSPLSEPVQSYLADYERLERQCVALLEIARTGRLLLVRGGVLSSASVAHIAQAWGATAHSELQRAEAELLRFALMRLGALRVGSSGQLRPTRTVVEWLARPHFERLHQLLEAWVVSDWDALRHLLGFQCKADTPRDLVASRRMILAVLAQVAPGRWLNIHALCDEMRRLHPDFARPAESFESWQLYDRLGRARDGFAHWDDVEGALVRATVECDLHWLGLCDKAYDDEGRVYAFRLTPLAATLLNGEVVPLPPARPIVVQPNYDIIVPPDAAPLARFQVARIAERTTTHDEQGLAIYRLTRACVEAELDRGARVDAIDTMLREASAAELPPNVAASLHEWGRSHGRLRVRRLTLLHADDSLLMARLRRDRRLRLRDAEMLGETTLAVPEAQASTIAARLRKAGYSLADETHNGASFSARELIRLAAALRTMQALTGDQAGGQLLERVLAMLDEQQCATVEEMAQTLLRRATEEATPMLHLSEL
jgi:hypothetical protein